MFCIFKEKVSETYMDGQVESLEIGGVPISLWNFKESGSLRGAPER